MGRERSQSIARGVRLRQYASGCEVIEIQFHYRGVTCKETLKNLKPTKANCRYAINLKAEIENAITRHTFNYADYFPDSRRVKRFGENRNNPTIATLLVQWLNDIERSHPHSTFNCYQKSCRVTLIPYLGDYKLRELVENPEPIRAMIRSREVKLKTIRNDLIPLKAVFDRAITDDLITKNPMDRIKVKCLVKREQSTSDYDPDPFSLDEIEQLLACAADINPLWRDYFQFAFFTGLRTSEQYALTWSRVDFARKIFRVEQAIVEGKAKGTKTKSSERSVDLLPMAERALLSQKRRCAAQGIQLETVWFNPHRLTPIMKYHETYDVFVRMQDMAGLRRRDQKQTRHSYASNLLSGGDNPLRVSRQMGHKDTTMVMRVYGKWIKQSEDEGQSSWLSEFGRFGT